MKSTNPYLFFLLLICSLAVANAAEPITLVTLGDSLTQGDGDLEIRGGYPTRLATRLKAERPGSVVINLGQSGWTSDDLINTQLEPALKLMRSAPANHAKVAIVWIGSNDLFGLYNYVCDEEFQNDYSACEGNSLRIFSENIQRILTALKSTGATLYIALLDDQSKRPVMTEQEKRTSSFDKITKDDVARMSALTVKYNEAIRQMAERIGASTVDFSSATLFTDPATLDSDGNHPNGKGYDMIADVWYQAITTP